MDWEMSCAAEPALAEAAHRSGFRIGGVSVGLAGERAGDVALVSSLIPFEFETGAPDVSIQVERVAHLSFPNRRPLFDSGSTWRLYRGGNDFQFDCLQFDFMAAVFGERPLKRLVIDSRYRRAMLQMNEECQTLLPHSAEPLGYPLDELLIMHRLTQEKAIELHGCGIVGAEGVGNLFVGHSGAGKSTTARLWTATQEVEILSDDRIIVRLDEEEAVAEASRSATGGADSKEILRLQGCSAVRTSGFAQDDRPRGKGRILMYGTPWHGEAMFASPASAPLTRILVLEHGQGNVLMRLSPSEAVAELFARSFVPMHRHEYVESALEFLQQVAESVPCYRYLFQPDVGAVEKILNLHD